VRFHSRTLTCATLLVSLLTGACGRDRGTRASGSSDVKFSARDSTRILGAGDIQISSVDTTLELALVGDTVIAGLGSRVLNEIRDKTDTGAATGNDLGSKIEKIVKNTVADAMSHQFLVPVAAIKDIQYANGTLQFFGRNGSKMRLFDNSRQGGKRVSETFSADDAQRFIDAFVARKTGRQAM
jgi:hypothetical protein